MYSIRTPFAQLQFKQARLSYRTLLWVCETLKEWKIIHHDHSLRAPFLLFKLNPLKLSTILRTFAQRKEQQYPDRSLREEAKQELHLC